MHNDLYLLRELVRRDFKARYAGSALGFLWSFALPVWQLLLFTFVFAKVMKIRLDPSDGIASFAVFLFCGLLPWTAFQEGVQRASTAITDNAMLVSKQRFPSALLVATVTATALLHEVVAGAIFAGYLAVSGQLHWPTVPVLLLALPLQIALTLGLGLGLAAVHVFVRDTAQAIGMVLFGWFYVTPIVYPLSLVPEELQPLVEANPLTALVGLYRWALLGTAPPRPTALAVLVGAAVLVLFAGAAFFRRCRPAFVDEL